MLHSQKRWREHPALQATPVPHGPIRSYNIKMANALYRTPPEQMTPRYTFDSSLVQIGHVFNFNARKSLFPGSDQAPSFESTNIAKRIQHRCNTFGSKNHIAGFTVTSSLQLAKENSPIKEFWFKLWHALDKWKQDANKNKNRLFSGHELPPLTVPAMPLDSHLMQLIVRKIEGRPSQEELRLWQTPLNTLCAFLAKWPAWSETIDSIFPHHYKSSQAWP